jgi:hypothetical protein
VQHVIERDDLLRRMAPVARLRAQAVHPADHALVEFRMRAHGIEHLGAVLEQPGQDLVDVGDGKRVVRAVVARRPRGASALAIPGLARRITVAHEQDVLALRTAWHEHRHGFRLREAGEVVEVAVGPVRILDIVVAQPDRRRGHDGDGVAAHELHERAAAALEFVAADGRAPRGGFAARGRRRPARHASAHEASGSTQHRVRAPARARARAPRTTTGLRRARIPPPRRTRFRSPRSARRRRRRRA